MHRNIVLILVGIAVVFLLGTVIMFSCGPGFRYNHMYGDRYGYGGMMDPDYEYDGMMSPGYDGRGMTGRGYGYRGMTGPRYGHGRMMGPGYESRGYDGLEFMASELNLTDDQAEQLYDLATNYRLKYYESRGNLEELDKHERQHRKDIEKVLTPEQKKIFGKYKRGFDRYGWFGGCPYH